MQGIFVGTFLIGLREGLEAALIVSIVGAFLARNGNSVRPMFAGVGLAVLISIGVGAGLELLSTSLPQRQQEMLETVIGAIAVVFVTTMIIWMNRNAFRMKGELEREAARAINGGGAFALAVMAFLAVLKEGFETAVFLLAAAQASQGNRWFAVFGGVAGIGTAVVIGVGIYFGSLKLNLGRFFRITGVFLVFIAAGLVTEQPPHGTRGRLGRDRPAAHRRPLVLDADEVLPRRDRHGHVRHPRGPAPHRGDRLAALRDPGAGRLPVAGALGAAADGEAPNRVGGGRRRWRCSPRRWRCSSPTDTGAAPGPTRTATTVGGNAVTATLQTEGADRVLVVGGDRVRLAAAGQQSVDGVDVDVWQANAPADPDVTTNPIGLAQLAELTGGRLPVGLGGARAPGPFDAQWSAHTVYTVLAHGDDVVTADRASTRVATLHGGGLTGSKTVSVGGLATDWATAPSDDQHVAAQLAQSALNRSERRLWTVWLPTVFALAAVLVVLTAVRTNRTVSRNERERQNHESPARTEITVS